MNTFKNLIHFLQSRSGATAMEYALIGGIICIAIVGGATALGESTNATFVSVSEKVPWGAR